MFFTSNTGKLQVVINLTSHTMNEVNGFGLLCGPQIQKQTTENKVKQERQQ